MSSAPVEALTRRMPKFGSLFNAGNPAQVGRDAIDPAAGRKLNIAADDGNSALLLLFWMVAEAPE